MGICMYVCALRRGWMQPMARVQSIEFMACVTEVDVPAIAPMEGRQARRAVWQKAAALVVWRSAWRSSHDHAMVRCPLEKVENVCQLHGKPRMVVLG